MYLERRIYPEIVHCLFYAIKDSLDYATVTGGINGKLENIPDDPLPEETLAEYERVTVQDINLPLKSDD